MAGNVSLRSGSVTISASAPNCPVMISCWEALVAMVTESEIPSSLIWRTTRCTMDSVPPSGEFSNLRNCLERVWFDNGHSRFPEPPESNMIFLSTNVIIVRLS